LTAREREILTLFSQGLSYAEIADVRGNSRLTIRNAIYGIQDKLGIETKQELAVWAVRNGLLDDSQAGM
jgi:DNA-binding CsgD family transcriptional regulator